MSDLSQQAHTLASVTAARLEGFEKTSAERYERIDGSTTEIKGAILALSADLKGAVQRIHERIDDEASISRNQCQTVANVAHGEVKVALDDAEDAHKAISNLQIKGLVAMGLGLLAIVGFFVAPFFAKSPNAAPAVEQEHR